MVDHSQHAKHPAEVVADVAQKLAFLADSLAAFSDSPVELSSEGVSGLNVMVAEMESQLKAVAQAL
ncbi:hypothetical protein GURASL_30210 [Geotalea uraniireducens]|uniref:Uncharacterized protein n=1 Tax=Geotalea uraniireducens TaxID=351604 RepID=A0ABM8EP99_9BACT|nr:hypothetical protein [Geotalea uraniireducens]BDV44098.1 hypothetical protein GURASL_30210 [Geotalea uraniireducens]